MTFEFATTSRILFGPGKVREVGRLAKECGRRALVVTGRDSGRAATLLEVLRAHEVASVTFAVPGEPEVEMVETGVRVARAEQCDLVISFGGGSPLDAAKAIAAMLTNPGVLMDYLEVIGRAQPLVRPSAPFIAIPTTAGTGSEVTRNSVLSSSAARVKVSLRGASMLPRLAIVDPELTYSLPSAPTAYTGLDALTQLIEPYTCSRANPITDGVCREGLRRVARSLRLAFHDGANTVAREEMCLASLCGGLALANAGLGAVHGFASPIGGMFPAPHGAICAALLPHVMEANLRGARQRESGGDTLRRYDDIASLLTGTTDAKAESGIAWVRDLVGEFRIPGLAGYGLTRAHTAELVDKASKANSMKANPVALTTQELADTLERAL